MGPPPKTQKKKYATCLLKQNVRKAKERPEQKKVLLMKPVKPLTQKMQKQHHRDKAQIEQVRASLQALEEERADQKKD